MFVLEFVCFNISHDPNTKHMYVWRLAVQIAKDSVPVRTPKSPRTSLSTPVKQRVERDKSVHTD